MTEDRLPRDDDPSTAGWDAIDAHLSRFYPGQTPLHTTSRLPSFAGGGLIEGISAYRAVDPVPHWHFVTYGFSELYAKETADAEISGFGFELTFRLAPLREGEPSSSWASNFLQNLGAYVGRTGNGFGVHHAMDLQGPIALGQATDVKAIAFGEDPQLGIIATPNGRVRFLQIVGLTLDECEACDAWDTAGMLEVLRGVDPRLLTWLDRKSILELPEIAAVVAERTAAQGSSRGMLYVGSAAWRQQKVSSDASIEVELGANGVQSLKRVLPGRIPHGRQLAIVCNDVTIVFEPNEAAGSRIEKRNGQSWLVVQVPRGLGAALANTLMPKAGIYTLPELSGIRFKITKSEIRDPQGNVVKTIG
ncbi:MAG TPA: suppressor of fused domain protein [Alphaproteobacteria bacterium]